MANKKSGKKSHRLLKALGIILLLIIILCGALAYWQRENISAVITAANTGSEDIAAQMTQSKANTQEALNKYDIPIKRDFTVEEEEEIRSGALSVEEAVSRIMSDTDEGASASSAESGAEDTNSGSAEQGESGRDKSSASGSNQKEYTQEQQIVIKYVTELYSLKAYYIGQLGQVEKDLKAQYKASYGTEKNAGAIAKVVQNNMGRVMSLEAECDQKVETVLTNMRNELIAIGADTAIADVVEDSYMNEKSLRKSYYLSLYK